jgi:hypothetical protein
MSFKEVSEILHDPRSLGAFLVEGIKTIDRECSTLINGVEAGLCNVKRQFADAARDGTKKKLREENLISWRLKTLMDKVGIQVATEKKYPGCNKKCDLVILADEGRIWIEVKLAWKNWFNCKGTEGTSSNYKGYLFGDLSHPGTSHDFHKLERLTSDNARRLGLLLIGFDSLRKSMQHDIDDLAEQEKLADRGWAIGHHDAWLDRRNEQFRINCWFWSKDPLKSIPRTSYP